MPYSVKYNQKKDCIMVAVQGELNLPTLQNMASEVSEIVNRTDCRMILNDLREVELPAGPFDIIKMPDTAKDAGVTPSCKRALIVGDRASNFRFLETVFINKGHMVKMFADRDSAETWLYGKSEGEI